MAAPGEPRVLTGTLEWPTTLAGESVVVVRGDDGALYYVDASTAERPVNPISGRVAVVGLEGAKPQHISAVIIAPPDRLVGASESPRNVPPAEAPRNAAPADVAASPRTESVDDLWRVQGKVRSVSAGDIVVETTQGQAIRVDASKLSAWTTQSLRPGDEVKLYGNPQEDNRLVANGFIHLLPSSR